MVEIHPSFICTFTVFPYSLSEQRHATDAKIMDDFGIEHITLGRGNYYINLHPNV